MVQVQIIIELKEEGSHVNIFQLAREDATPDERGYAQALEDLLLNVLQQAHDEAGTPFTITPIEPYQEPE